MDNYNKVRKLLFSNKQIDLKSEKVELGLADDIKTQSKKADAKFQDSVKILSKIMPLIDKAITDASEAVKIAKSQQKESDKLDSMAKELGVDLPADVRTAQQTIYDIIEGYGAQHLKDLQKMKSSI